MQVTLIASMTGIKVATQGREKRHKIHNIGYISQCVPSAHIITIASYHVLNLISCHCILIASWL